MLRVIGFGIIYFAGGVFFKYVIKISVMMSERGEPMRRPWVCCLPDLLKKVELIEEFKYEQKVKGNRDANLNGLPSVPG